MSLVLDGPINTQTPFMMVQTYFDEPYALMLGTGGTGATAFGGSGTYTMISLTQQGATATVGVFSAQGTESSVTIKDTSNGGWLGINSFGELVNTTSPATFNPNDLTAPQNQPWQAPALLLADIDYTLVENTSGKVPTVNILGSTGIYNSQLIFESLPVIWYFNCSSTYDVTKTAEDSLILWSCSINPNIEGCSDDPPPQNGWTVLADCLAGNAYEYCPTGTYCGTNECNGPCQAVYDNCTLQSGGQYTCVLDPKKYFSDTKWWESKLFIGVTVAVVAVMIALVVVVFVILKHRAAQNEN